MKYLEPHEQTLLVRTLLAGDQEAVDQWNLWKDVADLESLAPDSFVLLPLVYHRLRTLKPDDEIVSRLGSVYRQATYRNELTAARLSSLLQSFHDHGIPALLLSGVALSEFHYPSRAVRPYQVVQVAVQPAQIATSGDLLEANGWQRRSARPMRLGACRPFRHESGFDLDLCDRVLFESPDPAVQTRFWEETTVERFQEVPVLILEPHAQLLLSCVRSLASMAGSSLLWRVDAARIFEKAGSRFDVRRLISLATETSTVLHVRESLRSLQRNFDGPLIGEIIEALSTVSVSPREMAEFRANSETDGVWGRLPWLYHNHLLRGPDGKSGVSAPRDALVYVRDAFGLTSNDSLAFLVVRKLIRRLFGRTRR